MDWWLRAGVEGLRAAVDCAEKYHRVSRRPVTMALGTYATRKGRTAGIDIGGGYATFPGVLGTVTRFCDVQVGRTGLGETDARAARTSPIGACLPRRESLGVAGVQDRFSDGRISMIRVLLLGAAAGAAGTTALNAATYLDMAVRGRPTSSTPEDTVEALAAVVHARVPGDDATRPNRLTGLGALTGIAAGVGAGAAYGVARAAGWRPTILVGAIVATLAVEVAGNGPMTALKVTDPRTWPASSWAADLGPHLAYGVVAATVMEALDPR